MQFADSRDILQDHWRRNGPPPPPSRLARTSSVYPIPAQPAERVQSIQPISVQHVPAPQTYTQSTPVQSIQAPAEPAPTRRAPQQSIIIHSAPAQPVPPSTIPLTAPAQPDPPSEISLPVPPVPSMNPLTLPTPQANQPFLTRSAYPPAWQDLIDHSCTYLLHDMVFAHPFPSGADGQTWTREAVSAAFISYSDIYGIVLDKRSCEFAVASMMFPLILRIIVNEHRSNIVTIVSPRPIPLLYANPPLSQALKAARSHRGRFRSTILQAIYDSDIGINAKTPAAVVAERVEILLDRNRFLDAPYIVSIHC